MHAYSEGSHIVISCAYLWKSVDRIVALEGEDISYFSD